MSELRIALYSPANLNVIDGSAIWVQAIAETLHVDPELSLTLPLKAPERRDLITRLLRQLDRVELIEPHPRRSDLPDGLTNEAALDLLEELDRERRFHVVLLRSFDLCRRAAERPRIRDRLWSAYVLEPEREIRSPAYRADLAAIAQASRHVFVQSEEMRALYEQLVPSAADRLALLPPAIPDEPAIRAPEAIVPRLIYSGKFHPFYPVRELIAIFETLRRDRPELTFHVAGDKIHRPVDDPSYAPTLERALMGTPGLVWHGGIGRDEVEALLAEGGIALSVWARETGPWMNDLVISTKLLDYCSVGLPVVLDRTAAQEALLGIDYPLFVSGLNEVEPLLGRLLEDGALYRDAAERCWRGSRRFTYPAVHRRLAPYLAAARDRTGDPALELESFDRPKLAASVFNVGLLLDDATSTRAIDDSLALLERLRGGDARFRLVVRATDRRNAVEGAIPERLREAVSLEPPREPLPSWFRRLGFLVVDSTRERRPAGVHGELRDLALASGTVPLLVGKGDGREGLPAGSIESICSQVRALVDDGAWETESLRARGVPRDRVSSPAASTG
jgi:glycosyltransferase involved in cell wall biosynthesis